MLAKSGIFSSDVPIGHPAELPVIALALQDDQKWVERHLLFIFTEPRIKPVRKECGHNFELCITAAQLKIKGYV